jgi:hypothetical protein
MVRFPFGRFPGTFWRVQAIASLVRYPEKTDRLEQRRRRGKPTRPRFQFLEHVREYGRNSKGAIDPLVSFSLSSSCATCDLIRANARD